MEEAQVIHEDEFELISLLSRGSAFAQSGRLDLAEFNFRRALKLAPQMASIYNDLGYVLQGQNRYHDALIFYYRGVELEPRNAQVWDNIARLYYDTEELEKAKEIYESLIRKQSSGALVSLPDDTEAWSRNLATINYQLGFVDEALCYYRSKSGPGNLTQSAQFARALLSEDQVSEAVTFLGGLITFFNGQVSPNLMVDYGIGLYDSGDENLAKEAFDRVIAQGNVDSVDRKAAYLFRLDMSIRGGGNAKEADYMFNQLLNEDSELCEDDNADEYGYWPTRATNKVLVTLHERCEEQKENSGFSLVRFLRSIVSPLSK